MSGAIQVTGQVEERKPRLASVAKPASGLSLNFSRRIPELDGFRGLAIMQCLFFHYVREAIVVSPPELLGYIRASTRVIWSGVDMFFVLSGLLIGGILLDARESPNYFRTFYIRRFCRILPIYFVFLGLVGIAFRFVYRPIGAPLDWIFAHPMPWYSYLSFTNNFWMAKVDSLGASILVISWSLAVEEQFYFVLPAVIRFVRRSALPYVFMAGIAIAPLFRLFVVYRFRGHLWATYALLPSRMDSLCLGALCAYSLREPRIRSWLADRRGAMWMGLLVLLAGMPALNNKGVPFTLLWMTVGYGWMSLFYATIIMLAVLDSQNFLGRAMRWQWLRSLGEISYGIYLFHLGIYLFCMWILAGHGWRLTNWTDLVVTLHALAITLIVSKLSWVFLEKPFVLWGHNWRY